MNRMISTIFLSIVTLCHMAGMSKSSKSYPDYKEDWAKVKSFEGKGQYTSALAVVDQIHSLASQEENTPQLIKTFIYRFKYTDKLGEDGLKEALVFAEQELETADPVVKSFLYSLIAENYTSYYNGQRWTINDLHTVNNEDESDFTLWSGTQFKTRIADYYLNSVGDDQLKELDIDVYDAVIKPGKNASNLRPSAYDILLHRAIDHVQTISNAKAQEETSFYVQQIRTLAKQRIDEFKKERNTSAWVDLSLRLLRMDQSQEANNQGYLNSLEGLMKKVSGHPSVAEVAHAYYSNKVYQDPNSDLPQIESEITDIIQKYSKAYGTPLLKQLLVHQLQATQISFTHEAIITPNKEYPFLIRYRNVAEAYLHYAKVQPGTGFYRQNLDKRGRPDWSSFSFEPAVRISLPGTQDMREHSVEYGVPSLPKGEYLMVISTKENLDYDQDISWSFLKVSNFSAVWHQPDLYVVDRFEGVPIAGVKVELLSHKYNEQKRKMEWMINPGQVTDRFGKISVKAKDQTVIARLSSEEEILYLDDERLYISSRSHRPRTNNQVSLYTDRSVYRPGQNIQFSGLIYEQQEIRKSWLKGANVAVELLDANRQKIADLELISDEFGAIQGVFNLPKNVLPGIFYLQVMGEARGGQNIRVEEYKRPQVETIFLDNDATYVYGDTVRQSIKVQTYFKSPIEKARVQYRVVKNFMAPYYMRGGWYGDCIFPWNVAEVEVATGELSTTEGGTAEIEFLAELPQSKFKGINPWSQYKVYTTVIAPSGEQVDDHKQFTLSNQRVTIQGVSNLVENIQDGIQVKVKPTNFDGQAVSIIAKIQLYQLQGPEKKDMVNRLWPTPDQHIYDKREFNKRFPDYPQKDEYIKVNWQRTLIQSWDEQLEGERQIDLSKRIASKGHYILELKDDSGEVLHQVSISTYDLEDPELPPYMSPIVTGTHKANSPGEYTFDFYASSSSPVLFIDHNKEAEWAKKKLNTNLEKKDMNASFIQWVQITKNRHEQGQQMLPYKKDQELLVKIVSGWKDTVEPGEEIKWDLLVTDKKGNPVKGAFFITVFDRSLNVYSPHHWSTSGLQWAQKGGQYLTLLGLRSGYSNNRQLSRRHIENNQREYPRLLTYVGSYGRHMFRSGMEMDAVTVESAAPPNANAKSMSADKIEDEGEMETTGGDQGKPRTNLTEAAYFGQEVRSDRNGRATISFKMSEALSDWQVNMMAFDQDFKVHYVEKSFATSKPLLIQPFVERFLRSGDQASLSARLSNMNAGDVQVTATLDLYDPLSNESLNDWFTSGTGHTFLLPDNQNEVIQWSIQVPKDFTGLLGYTMSVKGGLMSDGEKGILPVLTSSKEVTTAYSFFLNPNENQTKTAGELGLNISEDQWNQEVSIEKVAQPLWFVFKSLPYQAQTENKSIEQAINTFYINAVGKHVLSAYPWLKGVIATMDDSSALSKKSDLKHILLGQTPYLRYAKNEEKEYILMKSFFDASAIEKQLEELAKEIKSRQLSNGGFSWMPGGRDSWYMSQLVLDTWVDLSETTGISINEEWINQLRVYCKGRFQEYYKDYMKYENQRGISALALRYLSTFSQGFPNEEWGTEENFLWDKAKKHWLDTGLMSKAMIAQILIVRQDDQTLLRDMKQSFDETMIDGNDRGKFWKYNVSSRWNEQDILVHSELMKVYHALNDTDQLPGLITYLVQNKRTQGWSNKMSSVAAIQSILATNPQQMNRSQSFLVRINNDPIGNQDAKFSPAKLERLNSDLNQDDQISIENPNDHIAWVNVYRTYTQKSDQIKSSANGPLKVTRSYYNKSDLSKVRALNSADIIHQGDRILVRYQIETDRDMEFVQVSSGSAGGFDPGVSLSGYVWGSGLSYYKAVKDTGTDLFIDFLPRGIHVIELELHAKHSGKFSGGLAEIQCLYAPEFRAHSDGAQVTIVAK